MNRRRSCFRHRFSISALRVWWGFRLGGLGMWLFMLEEEQLLPLLCYVLLVLLDSQRCHHQHYSYCVDRSEFRNL